MTRWNDALAACACGAVLDDMAQFQPGVTVQDGTDGYVVFHWGFVSVAVSIERLDEPYYSRMLLWQLRARQ